MPRYGGVLINNSKKTIRVHYWSLKGVRLTKEQLLKGMKPEARKAVDEAILKGYKWI